MTAIRSFIAIEIPETMQQKLADVIKRLQDSNPQGVRWVSPKNIHLTLKFLGDISPKNLDLLCNMLQVQTGQYKAFSIQVEDVGAYPNSLRPRVIWVGIKAPDVLESLQKGIEAEARRLGYAAEDRPFSPHLTIGRVARSITRDQIRRLSQTIETIQINKLGDVCVSSVNLFRSDLKPGGAVYTPLFSSELAQ